MKFCNECGNKFYPQEKEGKLYMKCMDCGNHVESDDFVISETKYQYNYITDRSIAIKKNLKYDDTLKRTKKQKCPKCDMNNIMILEDSTTLESIYMCSDCLTEWKF